MLAPVALALLVASLVPPVWIALAGGADMDVAGLRLELYRSLDPGLALLGLAMLALLPAARHRGERVLRGLAALGLAVEAVHAFAPGLLEALGPIHRASRLANAGLALALVALVLARGRLAPARGAATLAVGLALGLAATAGVRAADRAELARALAADPPHASGPDVIFVLVDTLRADALGVYGARPTPSPFLDGLAGESVVFERALAQAPWTTPSVSSLLSALYPSSFRRETMRAGGRTFQRLPEELPWLPVALRQAGYHTAGFVKNPFLQRGSRFERGFQIYEWLRGDTAEYHSARQLVDGVLRWADVVSRWRERGGEGSFFLYVHFMDPHVQYRPPAAFAPEDAGYDGPIDGGVHSVTAVRDTPGGPRPEDLARLRALYRGEVAYLDTQLARLRRELAQRGLWGEDTVVVLVADHGEQFYEHGSFMHGDVDWENVHVPLLLRAPGLAPRRVAEPVALLDLAPTLLDLLGLPAPDGLEGRSLLPRLAGEGAPSVVVTELAKSRRDDLRMTGPAAALIVRRGEEWIQQEGGPTLPAAEAPEPARAALPALREAERHFRERPRTFRAEEAPSFVPDADAQRRLRAIGYSE